MERHAAVVDLGSRNLRACTTADRGRLTLTFPSLLASIGVHPDELNSIADEEALKARPIAEAGSEDGVVGKGEQQVLLGLDAYDVADFPYSEPASLIASQLPGLLLPPSPPPVPGGRCEGKAAVRRGLVADWDVVEALMVYALLNLGALFEDVPLLMTHRPMSPSTQIAKKNGRGRLRNVRVKLFDGFADSDKFTGARVLLDEHGGSQFGFLRINDWHNCGSRAWLQRRCADC